MISGKEILNKLLSKYEKSILSKSGTTRDIKIKYDQHKDNRGYFNSKNDEYAQELTSTLVGYKNKGFVFLDLDEDELVDVVYLNVDKVRDVAMFLGIQLEEDYNQELKKLYSNYLGTKLDPYIKDVISKIDRFEPIKAITMPDINGSKDLLKALISILELEEEVYIRILSVKLFSDSKRLENICGKVCRVLKEYFLEETIYDDKDVLAMFKVLRNPSTVLIKGRGCVQIGRSTLYLEDFKDGVQFSGEDLNHIKQIKIDQDSLITIENLTNFTLLDDQKHCYIYLGGFHNTVRENLLKIIYETNDIKHFYHFGDIDAGGFYILENLIKKTGIPFQPYNMDVSVLKQYRDYCKELTANDRKRLELLKESGKYEEVIDWMLENNKKLEQESLYVK